MSFRNQDRASDGLDWREQQQLIGPAGQWYVAQLLWAYVSSSVRCPKHWGVQSPSDKCNQILDVKTHKICEKVGDSKGGSLHPPGQIEAL